jgi:hypothetical protein
MRISVSQRMYAFTYSSIHPRVFHEWLFIFALQKLLSVFLVFGLEQRFPNCVLWNPAVLRSEIRVPQESSFGIYHLIYSKGALLWNPLECIRIPQESSFGIYKMINYKYSAYQI